MKRHRLAALLLFATVPAGAQIRQASAFQVTARLPSTAAFQSAESPRRTAIKRFAIAGALLGGAAGVYFEASGMNNNCPECPVRWEGVVLSTLGTAAVGAAAGALTAAFTHADLSTTTPLPSPASCSYDACALRLQGLYLVRGSRSESVGSVRSFSAPRMTRLMAAAPDSAMAHARIFDREFPASIPWLAAGTVIALAGFSGVLHEDDDGLGNRYFVYASFGVVGAGLHLVGARKRMRALDALSHAVWWYNRDLIDKL